MPMNQFFRDAIETGPQVPQGPGTDLGMLLAQDFIMSNPGIAEAFAQHLRKRLVPQQAQRPQRAEVDQTLGDLLAISQRNLGVR